VLILLDLQENCLCCFVLFCGTYFPIQNVTKFLKAFIYKALMKNKAFKVQIRYNTFQKIHF
jgi:hypothetical protein